MPLASFWVWACMPCNRASLFPGSALNPRGLTLWAACSRLSGHLDSVWTPLMRDSGRRFEGGEKATRAFPFFLLQFGHVSDSTELLRGISFLKKTHCYSSFSQVPPAPGALVTPSSPCVPPDPGDVAASCSF